MSSFSGSFYHSRFSRKSGFWKKNSCDKFNENVNNERENFVDSSPCSMEIIIKCFVPREFIVL